MDFDYVSYRYLNIINGCYFIVILIHIVLSRSNIFWDDQSFDKSAEIFTRLFFLCIEHLERLSYFILHKYILYKHKLKFIFNIDIHWYTDL